MRAPAPDVVGIRYSSDVSFVMAGRQCWFSKGSRPRIIAHMQTLLTRT